MIKFEDASYSQLERLLKLMDKMSYGELWAFYRWASQGITLFREIEFEAIMKGMEKRYGLWTKSRGRHYHHPSAQGR